MTTPYLYTALPLRKRTGTDSVASFGTDECAPISRPKQIVARHGTLSRDGKLNSFVKNLLMNLRPTGLCRVLQAFSRAYLFVTC